MIGGRWSRPLGPALQMNRGTVDCASPMSMPAATTAATVATAVPRFMTLDERVPAVLRKAIEEADGCLQMGFTMGGTACARLAMRTIIHMEHADLGDYAKSLAALGDKHPAVPPALFQIVGMLGGGDEPLTTEALQALIAAVKAIVYELYVLAAERVERLMYVHELVEHLKRTK